MNTVVAGPVGDAADDLKKMSKTIGNSIKEEKKANDSRPDNLKLSPQGIRSDVAIESMTAAKALVDKAQKLLDDVANTQYGN